MTKSSKFYIGLSMFIVLMCSLTLVTHKTYQANSDAIFLWNRIDNLLDCLKDGNYPFLYYNDFLGVGYGSSIFYGQLTLVPFIPFALCGRTEFTMMFFIVTCTLNIWGMYSLAKRFTKDCALVSLLYISSPLMFCLLLQTSLYANLYGVGIGLFFISACMDFFRDGKNYYKPTILFILLFNTHLITTLICFLICVSIFIYYFNKNRVKDYIKFCSLCMFISLYNICNYISHSSSLKDMSSLGVDFDLDIFKYFILSTIPVNELFCANLTSGVLFIGISILLTWLFVLFKCKISKKELVIHLSILLGVVIGIKPIWVKINQVVVIPFQFPIRYLPFLLGVVLILIVRRVKFNKVKILLSIFSVISFTFTCMVIQFEDSYVVTSYDTDVHIDCDEYTKLDPDLASEIFNDYGFSLEKVNGIKFFDLYIGNGEYVSSDFVLDADVFLKYSKNVLGNDNKSYPYKLQKDKLIVDLSNNTSKTITVPKLYYYGYVAKTSDGKYLNCAEGYSMFTSINVEGIQDTIEVYYRQPIWLVLILILDYCLGVYVIIQSIRKREV